MALNVNVKKSLILRRRKDNNSFIPEDILTKLELRGAFGMFLAWSFISVTDLQTLSWLVSFYRAIFSLYYEINFKRIL